MTEWPLLDTLASMRVVVADDDREVIAEVRALLEHYGHVVVGEAIDAASAAAQVVAAAPDMIVIVLHDDHAHTLDLIEHLRPGATGPVLLLVDEDTDFLQNAAERGVFATALPITRTSMQGAIAHTIRQVTESRGLRDSVAQLEAALARRRIIEQAKGILMERHDLDEEQAFERLRTHARSRQQRLVDVAQGVVSSRRLLA